jgi:anti-sigma B factor antagonist
MPPDPPSNLRYRTNNGVTVAGFATPYLQAEADIEKVGAELFDLVENKGLNRLIISFKGVRFVSSSMLAQVVKLQKAITRSKGRLRLCSLTPDLLDVVKKSNLDKLLDVVDDETAALNKF